MSRGLKIAFVAQLVLLSAAVVFFALRWREQVSDPREPSLPAASAAVDPHRPAAASRSAGTESSSDHATAGDGTAQTSHVGDSSADAASDGSVRAEDAERDEPSDTPEAPKHDRPPAPARPDSPPTGPEVLKTSDGSAAFPSVTIPQRPTDRPGGESLPPAELPKAPPTNATPPAAPAASAETAVGPADDGRQARPSAPSHAPRSPRFVPGTPDRPLRFVRGLEVLADRRGDDRFGAVVEWSGRHRSPPPLLYQVEFSDTYLFGGDTRSRALPFDGRARPASIGSSTRLAVFLPVDSAGVPQPGTAPDRLPEPTRIAGNDAGAVDAAGAAGHHEERADAPSSAAADGRAPHPPQMLYADGACA